MKASTTFQHQFVQSAPRDLLPSVLYISLEYCSMLHLCACGCGRKVVTPISPNDWSMTFNGQSVTVSPSIGSWSLPCRSHYLIKRGKVVWAGDWTDEQIKKARAVDLARKRDCPMHTTEARRASSSESGEAPKHQTWSQKLFKMIGKLIS